MSVAGLCPVTVQTALWVPHTIACSITFVIAAPSQPLAAGAPGPWPPPGDARAVPAVITVRAPIVIDITASLRVFVLT